MDAQFLVSGTGRQLDGFRMRTNLRRMAACRPAFILAFALFCSVVVNGQTIGQTAAVVRFVP